MEKVHFNQDSKTSAEGGEGEEGEEDPEEEDDYSASVSAILLRRASSKRQTSKRRRPSSTFSPEGLDVLPRRRSSNVTTTSVETAISIDEGMTEEHIFQNIKLHKEVLSNVKQQPWPMRRKVKLVKQAKNYVKKHEGELQERLAQSKTTKDMLACCDIIFVKEWQFVKRELANLMNVMVPWELRIKEIESHFGSVVASYFTFLRWLFWVNLVITLILITFVAIPEVLTADKSIAGERKEVLEDEKATATNFMTLWDFEGALKYSPIFYGYYSSQESSKKGFGYKGPLAYFITGLAVYIYSFVATLRRMAENSRQSKLSEKDDECVFTWKLFTGWDYMIGNSETAHNRTASIILGFKEALLEEAEKKRDERSWKMLALRIFTNINVLWLFASSVYAVVLVVERSTKQRQTGGWWQQNEVTIVVSLITNVFPFIFEMLGSLEQYHPRKRLRMQLARIMVLNMLNLYTFILASFSKISDMSIQLQEIKRNLTNVSSQPSELMMGKQEILTPAFTTISSGYLYTGIVNISQPSTASRCYVEKVNCTTYSQFSDTTASLSSSLPTSSTSESLSTISTLTTLFLLSTTLGNNTMLPDVNGTNLTSYQIHNNDIDNYNSDVLIRDNRLAGDYNYESRNNTIKQARAANTFFDGKNNNGTLRYIVPLFAELFNYNTKQNESLGSEEEIDDDEDVITPEDYPDGENMYETDTEDEDLNYTTTTLDATTSDATTIDDGCRYITVCPDVSSSAMASASTSSSQFSSISMSTAYVTETTEAKPQPLIPTISSEGEFETPRDLSLYTKSLDTETRRKLRSLCWETMFGQELVKLTVMDLVLTIVSTLLVDFIRAIFVRTMNNCWCWDLEKKFPQYGDFKIAENILHLVNNQGMVWMGMFFSPGLPLINLIKLIVMMYLRSWTVLTCNVPHEVVFRASSSNNFYLALLLTMLFLCVLPVSYAIVWVEPSWHCGPFSNYEKIYHLFTNSTKKALPSKTIHKALDYIASPGIVIPLLMLLVLIIYYLISLTNALREANNDLKVQLRRERTEERRKVFQMVDRKHRVGGPGDLIESTPFQKWQKTLNVLPNSKSDQTSNNAKEEIGQNSNGVLKADTDAKKLLSKLTKHTTHKHLNEENIPIIDADGTDIEQVESLPDDRITVHHEHEKSQHKHRLNADTAPVEVHKAETKMAKKHDDETPAIHQIQDKHGKHDKRIKDNEKHIKSDRHEKHERHDKIVKHDKRHAANDKETNRDKELPKQERKDSSASNRSENVPEIRISQSTDDESQEETKFKQQSKSSSADTIISAGNKEQIDLEKVDGEAKMTKTDSHKVKTIQNEKTKNMLSKESVKEKQKKHHKSSQKNQMSDKKLTTIIDPKHEKTNEDKDIPASVIKSDKKPGREKYSSDEKAMKLKQKDYGSKPDDNVKGKDHLQPEVVHTEKQPKSDSKYQHHVERRTDTDFKTKTKQSLHPDRGTLKTTKERDEAFNESEDSEEDKKLRKKKRKHMETGERVSTTHHHKPDSSPHQELSFKLKSKHKLHTDSGSQAQTTESYEPGESSNRTESEGNKQLHGKKSHDTDRVKLHSQKMGTEQKSEFTDMAKQKERQKLSKERYKEKSKNDNYAIEKDKTMKKEMAKDAKVTKKLGTLKKSRPETREKEVWEEKESSKTTEDSSDYNEKDDDIINYNIKSEKIETTLKSRRSLQTPTDHRLTASESDSTTSDESDNITSKLVGKGKESDSRLHECRLGDRSYSVTSEESSSQKDNLTNNVEDDENDNRSQQSQVQSLSLKGTIEDDTSKECSNESTNNEKST